MTRNPQILILDPELAQDVLVTNFGKFRGNLAAEWVSLWQILLILLQIFKSVMWRNDNIEEKWTSEDKVCCEYSKKS